jgi:type II secretion system protein N
MSAARAGGPGPLPRPLLWLGIPLAAVLLTGFFVFLGFPYDRVREGLSAQLGAATGARVVIRELGPGLSLGGPVLVAQGVSAELPDGTALQLDRARLRPAWSTAWLSGNAALAVDLAAPEGRLRGTVYAGGEPGFDGSLEGLDLEQLPVESWVSGLALDGLASAEIDLRQTADGPSGRVELRAVDGSLGLPGLPLALPFNTLASDVDLGEHTVSLERLELEGPVLSARGEGRVGPGADLPRSPLDVKLHLEVRDENLRPALAGMVHLDPDGSADLRLMGTLAQPRVRSSR